MRIEEGRCVLVYVIGEVFVEVGFFWRYILRCGVVWRKFMGRRGRMLGW